jgi:hypothetical protein
VWREISDLLAGAAICLGVQAFIAWLQHKPSGLHGWLAFTLLLVASLIGMHARRRS